MSTNNIKFKLLYDDSIAPSRGTTHSVGFDLYAMTTTLVSQETGSVLIKTGIAVELPEGTYGRIAIRSGHGFRRHLAVTAGVIDPDYRDELGVVVFMTKKDFEYTIQKGERFAQLIVEHASFDNASIVTSLSPPPTTHLGYGSTGNY